MIKNIYFRSSLYFLIIFSSVTSYTFSALTPGSWVNPIGVPTPSFGINEFISTLPSPWDDNSRISNSLVFYYVCPTCSGATDTSNIYGYPAKPRLTVPPVINGPAAVVLGGQINSGIYFTGNGTAENPIYVTSASPTILPHLTAPVGVSGSYVIFDYLWIGPLDSSDTDFGFSVSEGSHHIVLRNSEVTGNLNRAGGVGVGSWGYTGGLSASNILIDSNYIHHIGDVNSSTDQDAHCIVVNGSADSVWVTNNRIEYCSGDSIQIEAQSGRRNYIKNIYYAKNLTNNNRQSGGWIKNAVDVIFSQNIAHDFRSSSGGVGSCYGFQYDADNIWFIFNEAYNCNIGINIAGSNISPGLNAFIIGNVIHDIIAEDPANIYNSGAMVLRGGTNIYVVNNTINRFNSGINMPPGTSAVSFFNNILANKTSGSVYDIYKEGTNPVFVSGNNIFGPNANFFGVILDSSSVLADPIFVSSNDYHLGAGSPAIGTGNSAANSLFNSFYSRYSISIAYDYDKVSRPYGTNWEIGAYEYLGSDVLPPPPPPPTPTPSPTPTPTPTPTPIAGDLNVDHVINSLDWSIMNAQWFTGNSQSDLRVDGQVNSLDFAILSSNWGRTW